MYENVLEQLSNLSELFEQQNELNKKLNHNFITDANIDDEIDSLLFLITKGRTSTIKELTNEELLEFSESLQDDIKLVKTNIMELKSLCKEILSH